MSHSNKALPKKMWANALRKAAMDIEKGTKSRRLELAAKAVVTRLIEGDMSAVREFGDRIDGKVPQALIGGDKGDPPVALQLIEIVGVRPK